MSKKSKQHRDEDEVSLEEMSAVLQEMLRATLYFAGVKKAKLDEAADVYLDAIDEVFGEEEEGMLGVDEVVKVVEHMKKNSPELFK